LRIHHRYYIGRLVEVNARAATSAAQAGGFPGVDMFSGQGAPPPMPSSDEPAQFDYVDDTSVGCDPWGVVGDG
jgi:hypothetical protein